MWSGSCLHGHGICCWWHAPRLGLLCVCNLPSAPATCRLSCSNTSAAPMLPTASSLAACPTTSTTSRWGWPAVHLTGPKWLIDTACLPGGAAAVRSPGWPSSLAAHYATVLLSCRNLLCSAASCWARLARSRRLTSSRTGRRGSPRGEPSAGCNSGCAHAACALQLWLPACLAAVLLAGWLQPSFHWRMLLRYRMPSDGAPAPCLQPIPPCPQLRLLRVHGPIHHGCGHCGPARHAGGAWCSKEPGPLGRLRCIHEERLLANWPCSWASRPGACWPQTLIHPPSHPLQMGDRNLTVKRANSAVQAQQAQQAAGGAAVPAPAAPAPQLAGAIRVVKLMHAGERMVLLRAGRAALLVLWPVQQVSHFRHALPPQLPPYIQLLPSLSALLQPSTDPSSPLHLPAPSHPRRAGGRWRVQRDCGGHAGGVRQVRPRAGGEQGLQKGGGWWIECKRGCSMEQGRAAGAGKLQVAMAGSTAQLDVAHSSRDVAYAAVLKNLQPAELLAPQLLASLLRRCTSRGQGRPTRRRPAAWATSSSSSQVGQLGAVLEGAPVVLSQAGCGSGQRMCMHSQAD